ncbi:MAG: PIG-L family deacetylase, partial [Anaerolineaceae bacterium]|nr:PIG-L family deacetylase [Anaerolineaceae bacterium]
MASSIARPTLLAVLAHPDDETFGMGGTLALYAQRGFAVHLVCATRGEVGDVDPALMNGYRSVAELREAELRCAASKLGLTGVHFLEYRDSGMPGSPDNLNPRALVAQPLDQVTGEVVKFIRELCPQVVLTFDPLGGYRHPDHIFIHQATVNAFKQAGDAQAFPQAGAAYQPQRLYYNTISRTFLRVVVRILPIFGIDPHRYGRNKDIDLASLVEIEYPAHVMVDYTAVAGARLAASRCHESQGGV